MESPSPKPGELVYVLVIDTEGKPAFADVAYQQNTTTATIEEWLINYDEHELFPGFVVKLADVTGRIFDEWTSG